MHFVRQRFDGNRTTAKPLFIRRKHPMPRRDPTFSSADVIRIWNNNLNKEEKQDVLCFFTLLSNFMGGPGELTQFQIRVAFGMMGSLIGFIPVVGDAIDFFFEVIEAAIEFVPLKLCQKRAIIVARRAGIGRRDIARFLETL